MLCCDTRHSTHGDGAAAAARGAPDAPGLAVRTHDCAAAWIVELAGSATALHAAVLADALARVADRRPALAIVDLTRVSHLAAAAIGSLIRFRNRLRGWDADTVLVVGSPLIARQLQLLRLHRLFDIQLADAAPPPNRSLARRG